MAQKLDGKETTLSQLIARTTLKFGRKLSTEEGDDLTRIVGALALLTQAQELVTKDTKMARRLLEKANSTLV